MQRITISLDEDMSRHLDDMIRLRHYQSRSEALRDMLRRTLEDWTDAGNDAAHCVGSFSYVLDRKVRMLSDRLSALQHEHHNLVLATTVVRLDHDHSLETVIVAGARGAVRAFIDRIMAERGVSFGSSNIVTVDPGDRHEASIHHHHDGKRHLSPRFSGG